MTIENATVTVINDFLSSPVERKFSTVNCRQCVYRCLIYARQLLRAFQIAPLRDKYFCFASFLCVFVGVVLFFVCVSYLFVNCKYALVKCVKLY